MWNCCSRGMQVLYYDPPILTDRIVEVDLTFYLSTIPCRMLEVVLPILVRLARHTIVDKSCHHVVLHVWIRDEKYDETPLEQPRRGKKGQLGVHLDDNHPGDLSRNQHLEDIHHLVGVEEIDRDKFLLVQLANDLGNLAYLVADF